LIERYTQVGRELRECRHAWFDEWDWLINRILSLAGPPHIEVAPGEIAMDSHIHSMFSHCSIMRPDQVIARAVKLGLDAVAILDHNEVRGSTDAIRCAEVMKDQGLIPESFLVIPGTEINSRKGHIGALFVRQKLPKNLSPGETVRLIHEAGGLAIAVHPYDYSGVGDALFDAPFDAVEIECGAVFGAGAVARNLALHSDSGIAHLAALGSSDAHYTGGIGNCYTAVSTTAPTLEAVREAIVSRATVPHATSACLKMRRWFSWLPKPGCLRRRRA
jgi:predicted metal-dependent phosphoesterase TrpH